MDEAAKDVLDDLAIPLLLYIRSIVFGLPAIHLDVQTDYIAKCHLETSVIPRFIMPTRLVLLGSSIETRQTAAQVEASCTFVISGDHQALVSSD